LSHHVSAQVSITADKPAMKVAAFVLSVAKSIKAVQIELALK
jgi:hypothetical protein